MMLSLLEPKSRWHSFGAALLGASVAGTGYAFGIFSEVMKERLSYSQVDLSVVGSVGDTGLYAQVIGGLGIQYCGIRRVLLLSACLILVGNMYVWLAVQKLVPYDVGSMSVMYFFAQLGIGFTTCSCTTVAVRIFPSSVRGQVAGLAKSYYGLSSAVLATIASGYFNGHSVDFILFVAIMLPTVEVITAFNANLLPERMVAMPSRDSSGSPLLTSFVPFHSHLAGLFFLVLVVGALHEHSGISRTVEALLASVAMAYLLAVTLIPRSCYAATGSTAAGASSVLRDSACWDTGVDDLAGDTSAHSISSNEQSGVEDEDDEGCFHGPSRDILYTLSTWRCYAIMVVFSTVCGCGLLVINNIQAIAEAVHREPSPFFVTLLSVANAGGRIAVGVAADVLKPFGVSRLQLLTLTGAVMCASMLLLSFGLPSLFHFCILATGTSFGAMFSNMVAITADLYGTKFFSANYGLFTLSPAVGAYIFAVGLVAAFYPGGVSEEIEEDDGDNTACTGAHCFRNAFIVACICCAAATTLSLFIHISTPLLPPTSTSTKKDTDHNHNTCNNVKETATAEDGHTSSPLVELSNISAAKCDTETSHI